MEPAGLLLEDYAVVVKGGRIQALLPTSEVRRGHTAGQTINLPHHVLLPGFINLHTHAAMSLMRGLADDLPAEAALRMATITPPAPSGRDARICQAD